MTILDKIFATKREEVAAAKSVLTLADLKAQLADLESRVSGKSFKESLQRPDGSTALIAEVKKGSPSAGIIREDFDPVAIAKTYEQSGADALSVLTDVAYFQGSPEYLRAIRKVVNIPLLRKDFIYDPYQIYEAKVWGADAILLIVAGLQPEDLAELYQHAREIDLDVLVEVHDEAELDIALQIHPDIIGVNNRDLRTFETSMKVSQHLIPKFRDQAIAVSESALESHDDVTKAAEAGASAVLIGTAFTRELDIASKVREVMNR